METTLLIFISGQEFLRITVGRGGLIHWGVVEGGHLPKPPHGHDQVLDFSS